MHSFFLLFFQLCFVKLVFSAGAGVGFHLFILIFFVSFCFRKFQKVPRVHNVRFPNFSRNTVFSFQF